MKKTFFVFLQHIEAGKQSVAPYVVFFMLSIKKAEEKWEKCV